MSVFAWILIVASFIIAFIGLVYPIIPSVIFIFLGFTIYGLFYSFGELHWLFWVVQILLTELLFSADTVSNLVGVKKFGGTKAGIWGSTIGLLVGPFIIPVAGILIGPFLGAVLGELFYSKMSLVNSMKAGIGSLVGFLTSVVTKGAIQIIMIVIFIFVV